MTPEVIKNAEGRMVRILSDMPEIVGRLNRFYYFGVLVVDAPDATYAIKIDNIKRFDICEGKGTA